MGKHDVHTCGHLIRRPLTKDRIEWGKQNLCSDCKRLEEAKLVASTSDLEGSPKQIAWAESLRKDRLSHFDEVCYEKRDNPRVVAVREWIASHKDARWWIDFRDTPLSEITKMAVKVIDSQTTKEEGTHQ